MEQITRQMYRMKKIGTEVSPILCLWIFTINEVELSIEKNGIPHPGVVSSIAGFSSTSDF